MTSYFFPPDNSRARAVSLVPWGGGLILPRWSGPPVVWEFVGGNLVSAALSLGSTCGFAAAAADSASGAWLVQYTGSLVHFSAAGSGTVSAMPTGDVFTGAAYVPAYSEPYVVGTSGSIYAGSGAAVIGTFPDTPCWGLAASGTTLFSMGSGGLNTFALSGATSGTPGQLAYSMSQVRCIAASTAASAVAVGGYSPLTIASGYVDFAFSGDSLAVALGGSNVDLYIGVDDAWTAVQSVTGLTQPEYAAWTPNGISVLVSDPVSGVVQVYRYALGTLTPQQTIPVAGAGDIAVTPDGLTALVCRPSANIVQPLLYTGTNWVTGAAVAVNAPSTVITNSATTATVGYASGVAVLSLSGGTWGVGASLTLPYQPSGLTAGSGNVFAAGSAGGSGYFTAVSGASQLFTYSWAGSGAAVMYDQGQVVVSDPSVPNFWFFGNLFTRYQYANYLPVSGAFNGLFVSPLSPYGEGGTIFATASGSVSLYEFGPPYTVQPVRNGMVGILNNGSWTTTTLGSGYVPTALTFDASGNIWIATETNSLVEVGLNGVVAAKQTIPVFQDQLQSAPLGISAMTFLGSGLYGASSLAGPLVELI